MFAQAGATVNIDGRDVEVGQGVNTVSELSLIEPGTRLTLAHIANKEQGTGTYVLDQTVELPSVNSVEDIELNYNTILNPSTSQYQNAGDWNGILLAIQGIAAVLWAIVLGGVKRRKAAYSLSLLIGAAGFISVFFVHNQYVLWISYALMGCAWAAMLSMPFTILTNALSGGNIGTYLGLFNCTITVPQIVAALCGGMILHLFPVAANGAPQTPGMLLVSGILLLFGAAAVWIIKETYGSQKDN
ncbi:MFS transporter [Bacteroides caecimuris]|uniref:MFS transporter n=1 Tax=Bacteroides caecimuris TaxID=1796613 RepID=UPI0034E9392D